VSTHHVFGLAHIKRFSQGCAKEFARGRLGIHVGRSSIRTAEGSVASARHEHVVDAVNQPIQGAFGQDGVGEESVPVLGRAIGGHNHRAGLVAVANELEEVFGCWPVPEGLDEVAVQARLFPPCRGAAETTPAGAGLGVGAPGTAKEGGDAAAAVAGVQTGAPRPVPCPPATGSAPAKTCSSPAPPAEPYAMDALLGRRRRYDV